MSLENYFEKIYETPKNIINKNIIKILCTATPNVCHHVLYFNNLRQVKPMQTAWL